MNKHYVQVLTAMWVHGYCEPKKGLSEVTAIAILVGIVLVLSLSFLIFMQSNFVSMQDLHTLQRLVLTEKLNTVVRLINSSEGSTVFLFRRLDVSGRVSFFVYNGSGYVECSDVLTSISGGEIEGIYQHKVEDIMVVSENSIYSFKYYAKSAGYPDTGNVYVCTLKITKNALVTLTSITGERFSVFIVVYVNDTPYLVDIYEYSLLSD